MQKVIIILSFFLFLLVGCEDKPAQLKKSWSFEQYHPEIIELSKASFNGIPVILSKKDLKKNKGNPTVINKDCVKVPINFRQRIISYDCWVYDTAINETYLILEDKAYLYRINLEKTDVKIISPQIVLSNKTSYKDIKRKFPNAYAHINIGANYYNLEGYDWIYLYDDLPTEMKSNRNRLTLLFKDKRLKGIEYKLFPKYSEEEWEIYIKQKKIELKE